MSFPKYLLPITLVTLAAAAAQAVPAYPGLINTTQPDGTPVTIRLRGDEHFSWAESADGFTLLRDNNNYWTVAAPDASGVLRPGKLRLKGGSAAAQAALLGVTSPMPMTAASAKANAPAKVHKSELQVDCTFPTTGKRKLLMILVNFADTRPTFSREAFDGYMNGAKWKGIGSFRDFYLEDSYGQLDIETTVTPWVNLPGTKSTYTADNVGRIIEYALNILYDQINLADYDNDGDGILDGLAIIHQGAGQEATGNVADIWSHSSTLYGLNVGGYEVRRYTIQPELFGNSGAMSTIGVMCHEFGHNLGAPDFYDTDYESSGGEYGGTGVWDLLGSGAWNGDNGTRPAHTNMWQKILYGWVDPVILTESQTVASMPDATTNPVAYRFDTTSDGDYFILENRQAKGPFNSALPGSGLLVMHANDKIISSSVVLNTVNATFPQGCYTVAANSDYADPTAETYTYGYPNNADALFPAGGTVFNDRSTPASHAVDGRHSYKGIEQITQNNDGTVSFSFVAERVPASPRNFEASAEAADVKLVWEAPEEEGLKAYNIYRNGKKITTAAATATSYIDVAPEEASGVMEYTLDAEYSDGRISPPVTVSLRMPRPKVDVLSGTDEEQGVNLSWTVDTQISRMQTPGAITTDYQLVPVSGEKIEIAHRYTANDLVTYQGMKIRRIAFIPYTSLQESSYKLKIYETDADGANPVVVSEREVKELGTGIWNTVMLTKAVEIKPGKEYWTAIEMSPLRKVVQVFTESHDVQPGLGDLLRLNDGEWSRLPDALGDYVMYAILADGPGPDQSPIGDYSGEVNPDTDLYFPIGFRVYRDGMLVGETSSRSFIDTTCPNGEHIYSVTTLYKGNSETAPCDPLTVNVTGNHSAIETIDAAPAHAPAYRLDGTRVPDASTVRGLILRRGEKIIK